MTSIDIDPTKMTADQVAHALLSKGAMLETIHLGPINGLMNEPDTRARYAEICWLASQITENPLKKIDLKLGWAYGTRNRPDLWDTDAVISELRALAKPIADLPVAEDIRRELERRRLYHIGLVCREMGRFADAAVMHERAVHTAATPSKRAIEFATSTMELLHGDVQAGNEQAFQDHLWDLRVQESMLKQFPDDKEAAKWAWVDIPIAHRLHLAWLMGIRDYPEMQSDLAAALDLPNTEWSAQYAHWVGIAKAIQAFEAKDYERASLEADAVLEKGAYAASDRVALLIQARIAGTRGIFNAKPYLDRLINHPKRGGEFVVAVAKRELAKLSAA